MDEVINFAVVDSSSSFRTLGDVTLETYVNSRNHCISFEAALKLSLFI
jgi:hypothetical protein